MRSVLFSLCLVSLLAASGLARADVVQLGRADLADAYRESLFRFDAPTGRAWLEVRLSIPREEGNGTGYRTRWVKLTVPGLSFDAKAAQIVFNGEKKVVCGTAYGNGSSTALKLTGSCFVYRTSGWAWNRALYFKAE